MRARTRDGDGAIPLAGLADGQNAPIGVYRIFDKLEDKKHSAFLGSKGNGSKFEDASNLRCYLKITFTQRLTHII